MVTNFVEIINARLILGAVDATYGVQFLYETATGRTWEFDPNSDAIGQNITKRTGRIKVFFNPVENTMAFPEDASRPHAYVMSIENARNIYKLLTAEHTPNYWFALDMANIAEKKSA